MDPLEEFNDELLSAYLDDELSADVRARVERRLTTDPAARQLLDELQSVSQAVRQLPPAAIGEDMRDAILAQAERAKLGVQFEPPPAGAETASPAPKITVGRSLRGWIWAGLTVAAALLVMFFNPAGDDGDLPRDVALRTTGQSEPRAADERLEMRAAPEKVVALDQPAARPASKAEVDLQEQIRPDADKFAFEAAPPTADDATIAGGARLDEASGAAGFGGETRRAASGSYRASIRDDLAAFNRRAEATQQLLVIHVQMKPAAVENRSIDGLLARNGIQVQPPTDADRASGLPAQEAEERGPAAAGARPPLDLLLVEAPAAQVESCLADLDADTQNVLAMEVGQETAAAPTASSQSVEQKWQQYNRGQVEQHRRLQVAQSKELPIVAPQALDVNRLQQLLQDSSSGRGRQSRALRVDPARQSQTTTAESLAAGSQSSVRWGRSAQTAAPPGLGKFSVAESTSAANHDEMVQVLFVLSADPIAASSPPAADRVP